MEQRYIREILSLSIPIFVAACTFSLVSVTYAQERPRRGRSVDIEESQHFRDWEMRNLINAGPGRDSSSSRELEMRRRQAYQRFSNDFLGIQLACNQLLSARSAGGEIDPKRVSDAVSEIKKRAAGMRSVLKHLTSEEKRKSRHDGVANAPIEELTESLSSLRGLVTSFVRNPIFGDGMVVDVEMPAKARRDLEQIIELSDRIKKNLDKNGGDRR